MATATVRWLNDRNFVGVDSTGHSVVLSGQKNGIGVSPSQMLLVALAACSSVDVVEILEKKRKKLTLLEVTANGEQDPDPPWTYRRIHVTYRLGGKEWPPPCAVWPKSPPNMKLLAKNLPDLSIVYRFYPHRHIGR